MTKRKRTGTPVIFRKFRDGEVIALFPSIAGTQDVNTCQCYVHYGQHGSASVSLSDRTTLAAPTEYADLLRELERIGYDDLRVIRRPSMWHRRERIMQIRNVLPYHSEHSGPDDIRDTAGNYGTVAA